MDSLIHTEAEKARVTVATLLTLAQSRECELPIIRELDTALEALEKVKRLTETN